MEKKAFVVLIMGTILIVWLSGVGGFFPQTHDHIVRNPIFRDLIFEKWPVFYSEMNASLDYYFAYWLFPALIGKILYFIGLTSNVVWQIANIVLLVQTVYYLVITFMLISSTLRKSISYRNVLKLLLIFCSFGGISILGNKMTQMLGLYNGTLVLDGGLGIEHYSHIGVMNNFFLMLSAVFNQMIPALLCTAIFLITREMCIYGYLISLILLSSPYPAVGLFTIMFLNYVITVVEKRKILLREVFSFYNIYAIFWLIIVCLFYWGNSTAGVRLNRFWLQYDNFFQLLAAITIYHVCMWLCYYILVYHQSSEKRMLKIIIVCLIFFPLGAGDFILRASIPLMFILFTEVYKQIEEKGGKYIYLTNLLALAGVSPFLLLCDLGESIRMNGTFIQRIDPYYTLKPLQESDFEVLSQYVIYNPLESVFTKTIGKNNINLGGNPVVEYGFNLKGKRYIKRMTVQGDEEKRALLDDIAEESRDNIETVFLENPNQVFYEFNDNDILAARRKELNPEQTKVHIIWNNYQENIYSASAIWALDLSIENIGEQNILVGQEEEPYKSGVVVSLCDGNKNVLIDVFGYQYIKKTIFSGACKQMIMNLQKPERGDYYLKIDYFCDGINGESMRSYCEPQYYEIKVH